MNNLDIVSSIRIALKSLDFEIKDLKRARRGLLPFEYTNIQADLSDRLKAKQDLLQWLEFNGFTL